MSRCDGGSGALPLFAYGGMLEESLVSRLLERRIPSEPASLPGFRLAAPADAGGPHLEADERADVDGLVYRDLEPTDYERLDAYVGVGEGLYERRTVRLRDQAHDGPGEGEEASVYFPTAKQMRQAARLAERRRDS